MKESHKFKPDGYTLNALLKAAVYNEDYYTLRNIFIELHNPYFSFNLSDNELIKPSVFTYTIMLDAYTNFYRHPKLIKGSEIGK